MKDALKSYWPYIVIIVGAIAWIIGFALNPAGIQSSMFFKNGTSWFSDFYVVQDLLVEADYYRPQSHPWHDSNYVALGRMMFALFPYSKCGAIAFTLISCLLYFLAMVVFAQSRKLPVVWTVVAVACTSTFISTVERGNSIIVSAAAVVLFLAWFDNDVKWKRTLAAVALAFAGVSKVSPALLGFLYFMKWQWREMTICAVAALLLFFVPFFFPGYGGMDGICQWFMNAKANSQYYALFGAYGFPKLMYGVHNVLSAVGIHGEAKGVVAVRPFSQIFGIVVFLASFFQRKLPVRVFLVVAALLIVPGNQHGYCGLYLIPVMFWLMATERRWWLSLSVPVMFFAFVFPVSIIAAVCGMAQNVLLMFLAAYFGLKSVRARFTEGDKEVKCIQLFFGRFRELIVYCMIGASGATLDFIVYASLTAKCGIHYQIANVISVSFGIINNFFWNYFFNFRVKGYMLQRFVSFYAVGVFGCALSAISLWTAVEKMGVNTFVAKIGTIFLVTVVQFLLNKFVTFKKS